MDALSDLLGRLERAGEEGWETEYARVSVELSRDQAGDIACSDRAFASWFAFRYDAGPPGVALPAFQDAVTALLSKSGTALDAYCVLFWKEPIREDAPGQLLLALLCNGAACALKQGQTWLATWIAARAGIAAIGLGVPEHAWRFLDGLTLPGKRHPHLDKLAMFEPLRGNPRLERNRWIRAAITGSWQLLKVPAIPQLPREVLGDTIELSLEETFEELTKAGAAEVQGLLEAVLDAADGGSLQQYEDEPLVRELRLRSMTPGATPPAVAEIPSWFVAWARSIGRSEQRHLARMAGLVLAQHASEHARLAAALVLPVARATDLDLLLGVLEASEARDQLAELVAVAKTLRTPLADALVAAVFPEHVENVQGQMVLSAHLEELEALHPVKGGMVEGTLTMVRSISADVARDRTKAAPALQRLLASVRTAVGRLRPKEHLLVADIERAVSSVEVPLLTQGLLESLDFSGFDPLDQLVLSLAVRKALKGTAHETWTALTSKTASDALIVLRTLTLYPMRLQLLSELIDLQPPTMRVSALYFERANTRRSMAPHDLKSNQMALADFAETMRRSASEGDARGRARSTAAWIRLLVWLSAEEGEGIERRFDEAKLEIERSLSMQLEPFDRAVLHQARAHLLRVRSTDEAVRAFEEALEFVAASDTFRVELASELVQTMVRARRFREAAARGQAFLEEVSVRSSQIELGMLYLSVGESMAAIERWSEAKEHLEEAIGLSRGRNDLLEALGRMHLAYVGMAIEERALVEEQLSAVLGRRHLLDASTRRDADRLTETVALWRERSTADPRWEGWRLEKTRAHASSEEVGAIGDRRRLREALARCEQALQERTCAELIAATEAEWEQVREVSAFLLLDQESREREAQVALKVAAHLAQRLAEESPSNEASGLQFVLRGDSAECVVRWVLRGQQPGQRALMARLSRPGELSAAEWGRWRRAVESQSHRKISEALERVWAAHPSFLRADAVSEATWRWLESYPVSAAVTLLLDETSCIAVVMQVNREGARSTWVLGLQVPPPPFATADVPALVHDMLCAESAASAASATAAAAIEGVAAWMRTAAIEPICRFLGAPPSVVLWNALPGLRRFAPSTVWREIPVATTSSLLLPELSAAAGRRASTLLALADPGPGEQGGLDGFGVPTLERLAHVASKLGNVKGLASVGAHFGAALSPKVPFRDSPASAADLLREAAYHETIVLIAHGECEDPAEASFHCIDAQGRHDRLDVAMLMRSAEAFSRATVLLISCSSGRVGDSLVNSGGLAGALIASGARCVVAPLWPVRLDAAERVAAAVLRGISAGRDPWEVLAALSGSTAGGDVELIQQRSFIAWVG